MTSNVAIIAAVALSSSGGMFLYLISHLQYISFLLFIDTFINMDLKTILRAIWGLNVLNIVPNPG